MGQLKKSGIPFERISGLRPQVWLSVGVGFSREEIKAYIFERGQSFIGEAVSSLLDICLKITNSKSKQILSPLARQEALRVLLADGRISHALPELKRLKRQKDFLKRLDQALQIGRLAFAHFEEEAVLEGRLEQGAGPSPIRGELRVLTVAYEAWCSATHSLDYPLLLSHTLKVLEDGWPSQLSRPEEIWVLSVQTPESLERAVWEALGRFVHIQHQNTLAINPDFEADSYWQGSIENLRKRKKRGAWLSEPSSVSSSPLRFNEEIQSPANFSQAKEALEVETEDSDVQGSFVFEKNVRFKWERWHTLDDAAEGFSDELLLEQEKRNFHWDDCAVLIPDIPSIRRSLKRALSLRAIPLAEPRDPTLLRWDEEVKWALLPLEVSASNYERHQVISFLRHYAMGTEFSLWVNEMSARGLRQGRAAYQGGLLFDVEVRLSELHQLFGGKLTCTQLSVRHLEFIKTHLRAVHARWLFPLFADIWSQFIADIKRVGLAEKKAHCLFWLERFKARLSEASPPADRLKPRTGLRLYRLQQAPVLITKNVWLFGLPPRWFEAEGGGTYWFSEREREILSSEFSIRSALQVRKERVDTLKAWFAGAEKITVLDAHYDSEGREKETLFPILREIELEMKKAFLTLPIEKGSHHRYQASYSVTRPVQKQFFQLPSLEGFPQLTASLLDHYSRCSILALAYHRWKLKDVREPSTELWADVKGNILHEAVRRLLHSLDLETGCFRLSSREALEQAWESKKPKGLIQSPRVAKFNFERLIRVLESFCDKEREYLKRSRVVPFKIENIKLELHYPRFKLIGQPDRIDRHVDGLFILDYKTAGVAPHGVDMIERGYRLQLPFYALAAHKKFSMPILGLQFVELDRKGARKSGIFFHTHNGREPGKLTYVRTNSKSLVATSAEDVWTELESHLVSQSTAYIEGRFQALPNILVRSHECARCRISDLCGFRRLREAPETESGT